MHSSDFKRFFVTILVIMGATILLLLANDGICRMMIFSSKATPSYKMWRLFNARPKGEVAILGSSRAQAHYVPELIGSNVYNYGLDGSGQYETILLLHAILARCDSSPIIINLDPWGTGGVKLQGDYSLATRREDVISANEILPPLDFTTLPGIRFFGKLRSFTANWLNVKMSGTKHITNGAILERNSRNATEWEVIKRGVKDVEFYFPEELQNKYDKVLKAQHPPIFFVISPVSKVWSERFINNPINIKRLTDFMAKLNSYPNTKVIDFSSIISNDYPLSLFADPTHMNEQGAIRFSKELSDILRQ